MNAPNSSGQSIFLIKYGGNAMINENLKKEIVQHICSLKDQGHKVVLVHGGGPFIGQMLELAKIESEFIGGHRKTTPEAMQFVEMALKGQVNGSLVSLFNRLGYKAVGISGKDGGLATAKKRLHQQKEGGELKTYDLGQVGDIEKMDTTLVEAILDSGSIPVVTCLAADSEGNDFNINADMFAGHLAGALKATQYLVLTDIDGLLMDVNDPSTLIKEIPYTEIDTLIAQKVIQGGMIPKMESCRIALQKGAQKARIINGTKPAQIVAATQNKDLGTLIRP